MYHLEFCRYLACNTSGLYRETHLLVQSAVWRHMLHRRILLHAVHRTILMNDVTFTLTCRTQHTSSSSTQKTMHWLKHYKASHGHHRNHNDVESWHSRINYQPAQASHQFYVLESLLCSEACVVQIQMRLVCESKPRWYKHMTSWE